MTEFLRHCTEKEKFKRKYALNAVPLVIPMWFFL